MLQAIVRREALRAPLIHVVGRLSFYMDLAGLLTPTAWADYRLYCELLNLVRDLLVRLYRMLLELEMNCVCATASTWNMAAKHAVAWKELPGLTQTIRDLDAKVVAIVGDHGVPVFRNAAMAKYADLEVSWRSSEEARAACKS